MTTAASRDDSVVAIRQLAGRGGGEAGERLSIVLSSKDGRRSAAGAESSRTGARPAAYSGVWNSWDLASVAAGFVSTVSSKRSFAFSSSLQLVLGVVAFSSSFQLGLSLGHQPLSLVDIGELELAQRRATIARWLPRLVSRRANFRTIVRGDRFRRVGNHLIAGSSEGLRIESPSSQSGHMVLWNCRPIQKRICSSYISLMRRPSRSQMASLDTEARGLLPFYGLRNYPILSSSQLDTFTVLRQNALTFSFTLPPPYGDS